MMLARFRSIGWVLAVAVAVLGCYLISLRVATERNSLESLERDIAMARKQIRVLQTELGTRGQMTQLEQWNEQALALSAPEAEQFLPDAQALVALTERRPVLSGEETQLASSAGASDIVPVSASGDAAPSTVRTAAYHPEKATDERLMRARLVSSRPVAIVHAAVLDREEIARP